MILDTNALSALADGDAAPGSPLLKDIPMWNVASIVLGEWLYGIRRSRFRVEYENWLAGFLPTCRVLCVTERTANHYADLRIALKSIGRPVTSVAAASERM